MVVFDATTLMLLIRPESGKPIDSTTGQPIDHVPERIAHFISKCGKSKTRIGIPTPALGEVLVRSGSATAKIVEKIKEFSVFEILPFDDLSAIELAIMTKNAIDTGDKKSGSSDVWNKIKYDRQILAISRVRQATSIYTDDVGLRNCASKVDMPVVGVSDMELPPEAAQGVLPLVVPTEGAEEPTIEEIEEAINAESASPGHG